MAVLPDGPRNTQNLDQHSTEIYTHTGQTPIAEKGTEHSPQERFRQHQESSDNSPGSTFDATASSVNTLSPNTHKSPNHSMSAQITVSSVDSDSLDKLSPGTTENAHESRAPQDTTDTGNGPLTDGSNNSQNNAHSNNFLESLADSQPPTGYPFLRALHSFDSSSLSSNAADPEEDPANICLSFQESEIVLLHSIHPSGWGDATVLSTGSHVRGWIPTNYFTPYADAKVTPLLSAVLRFVLNPKSQPLSSSDTEDPEYSFSQSSITNIVAGVRSLLESCETLTRDSPIIRRSPAIRKFRKILLAELAILVSQAKQYRNTTEDANIERLVNGSYKIISRAVAFLDIWTIDTSNNQFQEEPEHTDAIPQAATSSIENLHTAASKRSNVDTAIQTIPEIMGREETATFIEEDLTTTTTKSKSGANRESVIFHGEPPFVRARLDEVNDALTSYLGNFIHRMTLLETDPMACTQILVNTRKSMLACRELLAAVEAISSKSLPRNKELEICKDKLFGQIRTLVTAARDVVASTPAAGEMLKAAAEDEDDNKGLNKPVPPLPVTNETRGGHYSPEGQRLIDIATDCARTSGECVVRCRHIIDKIGDFQMAGSREYPDFSDGIIASANGRKRSSVVVPKTSESSASLEDKKDDESEEEEKRSSLLPRIPLFSPIIEDNYEEPYMGSINEEPSYAEKETEESDIQEETCSLPLEEQIIIDDNGRVRGGSLDGLVKVLTDENRDLDPIFASTFFLTFRQFSNSLDFAEALVRRYGGDVDETKLSPEEATKLLKRRTNVYNMIKRWMECYWKNSVDVVVLPQIVNFANSYLSTSIPNAVAVLNDLASKVKQVADGEAIVPRSIPAPGSHATRMAGLAYSQTPLMGTQVTRHLAAALVKAVAESPSTSGGESHGEEESSRTSTWSNSLRMVKESALASVSSGAVTILDIEAFDIAKQLSLMDSQMFCQIKVDELLDLNFSVKRKHLGLAPNVSEMTLMSNRLSSFVGDSILSGDVAAKTRKNLIKHWIKIAERCAEMRNFNSLMTIVSTLQSVNIMRLKKTWEMLSPRYLQQFQELKAIVSMDKNYAAYRVLLRTGEMPTVPYLGLYLTDLTFVVEGNSTHRLLIIDADGAIVPPGRKAPPPVTTQKQQGRVMVINFDRYERTARIIGEMQAFQVEYRVQGSGELQAWLRNEMSKAYSQVSKDHNNLWRRSCIVEPVAR